MVWARSLLQPFGLFCSLIHQEGKVVIQAEITSSTDDEQREYHHEVAYGEFDAIVQLHNATAAIQVTIVAMLPQYGFGPG